MGLGWVDHATHQPKVTPLPAQHLPPRHEGNPVAAGTFHLTSGTAWTGEWVFTEPLTACSVKITDDTGAVVRSLSCDAAAAAAGEAVVSWDGEDGTGTAVDPGAYHWKVVASDGDGPAVDVGGTSTTITGDIDVTRGPPAYVPLAPMRLLDTRTGTGGHTGPVAGRHSVDVSVTGVAGIPSTGVAAVVLNVTATAPSAGGYVTVYPTGAPLPTASSLNYAKGQTIANQVVSGVGSGGKVRLYTYSTTHLIADVAGYYPTGGGYEALAAPSRIVDTRSGLGAPKAPIGSRHTLAVQVSGKAGVPADAAAVVLNVTATGSSSGGYLTVFPAGAARSTASNINYTKGQTIAGMVLARLGTGGKVDVYAYGATHIVVDVQGWIPSGADYTPLAAPSRFLDTRTFTGGHRGAVVGGHTITLQVAGKGGIPAGGVGAVMLNVTATGSTKGGYATVYPSGTSRPTASNLNYGAGATIANSVIAKLGPTGAVTIFVNTTTHLVVDVSGYWVP